MRTLVAMSLMTTLTACLTSPPASIVARADSQRGQFGGVYMTGGAQHSGELLAIDDSTVTLLTRDRIAVGSLSRVDHLSFDDFETSDVGTGHTLSRATLRRGRQASRFPYGITAPAMVRLLEGTRQSAPDRLEDLTP